MDNQRRCVLALTILSTGFVFLTVARSIVFLSKPLTYSVSVTWFYEILDGSSLLKEIVGTITYDAVLIIIFCLMHSLGKPSNLGLLWKSFGQETMQRVSYNVASCLLLTILITYWKPLPGIVVWEIDVWTTAWVYWFYVGWHSLFWAIIGFGSVLMDLPELLGLKQIQMQMKGLPPPMLQKTVELRRMLAHVRHPSLLGLAGVLWSINIMTLDRLLLAAVFTLYMYLAWNPDIKDCAYQRSQLVRKKYELSVPDIQKPPTESNLKSS